MVILVVALIVFGPRKLPQLSRSLGKSLSEFRRASDDFKRTWEREVALEEVTQKPSEPTVIPPLVSPSEFSIGRGQSAALPEPAPAAVAVAPADAVPAISNPEPVPGPTADTPVSSKRDWL